MEGISTNKDHRAKERHEGWDAWDAVPRDGPAVFVVDAQAFDAGIVRGRWIDLTKPALLVRTQMSELLGTEHHEGRFAIVDQVGIGGLMAPETLNAAELALVSRPGGLARTERVDDRAPAT